MLAAILSGIAAFIGTNIDDLFINAFFYAKADTRAKVRGVLIGKYLGIGFLVVVSLLGSLGLNLLPMNHLGILGLVPIFLGIREIVSYCRGQQEGSEEPNQRAGVFSLQVALVTVANGADNIGVYIPLFTGYTRIQLLLCLTIFAIMTALWCLLGKKIIALPFLQHFLSQYRHIIVPVVYIALGVYISGIFQLLTSH